MSPVDADQQTLQQLDHRIKMKTAMRDDIQRQINEMEERRGKINMELTHLENNKYQLLSGRSA